MGEGRPSGGGVAGGQEENLREGHRESQADERRAWK